MDAYCLMESVSSIMLSIEKNKRYAELKYLLEKKETYLALHKEVEELMDKHNFKKHRGYTFLEDEDEVYGNYTEFHYLNYLKHADMLVARDNKWRYIFDRDDF